ncbi:parasitic phase-specific protein PSP-1 [Thozetella sp. PMI_491]|nr:parasitic phase-specific protein PSP-1 [Thozetella sp. PMI_491]
MSSDPRLHLPPGIIVFGPHSNCTLDICPVEASVYRYRPSLAANYTFFGLYALALVIHAYLGFRWKSWFFAGSMVAGCINAIVGYTGRILMYYNPFNFTAFMIQIVCVTSGPVYYSAAIYVTLAAAINYFSPGISRFNPKLFYWVFIPCDLVSLAVQAAGGAISASTSGQGQIGVDLALAGMAFQVFMLVIFISLFVDYLTRYFRSGQTAAFGTRLKIFFTFMGLATFLILIRCIYRLVELREGYSGDLVSNEALFIGLEGVMIIVAVYSLTLGHPGFGFRHDTKTNTSELQVKQEISSDESSGRGMREMV